MNIKYAETVICETDDVVSSYVFKYNDSEIVISSFDSDFFQLINDKVSVLRYRGEKTIICTPEYIFNKFGILPSQYAEFKSLVGDKSDNIKGAENVGPKTACALINKYKTLDNIIENAYSIEKPSVKESIIRNAERLKTNYQIIKLGDKVPLPFEFNELEYHLSDDITTNEVLRGIGLK